MSDPLTKISEFMGHRTWAPIVETLPTEESEGARESALAELNALGFTLSIEEMEALCREDGSPIDALMERVPQRRPDDVTRLMRAACQFWNHTPRADLGGLTPTEHLIARIESRPDEEAWRVAAEEQDHYGYCKGPEYFQDLPDPSEFGLSDKEIERFFGLPAPPPSAAVRRAVDDTTPEDPTPRGRGSAQTRRVGLGARGGRKRNKLRANDQCPCGSGRKLKLCCGRLAY